MRLPGAGLLWMARGHDRLDDRGVQRFVLVIADGGVELGARLHTVNQPVRAMTGWNWDCSEECYRHAPHLYGAIHFHDDDLDECGWETDLTLTVRYEELRSESLRVIGGVSDWLGLETTESALSEAVAANTFDDYPAEVKGRGKTLRFAHSAEYLERLAAWWPLERRSAPAAALPFHLDVPAPGGILERVT